MINFSDINDINNKLNNNDINLSESKRNSLQLDW